MREGEPSREEENIVEEPVVPKRKSGLSKIIGASPEEEKDFLDNNKIEKKFNFQEREKTPEEVEMINGILEKIDGFVRSYGGTPVEVSPDKIHIVDAETMKQIKSTYGADDDMAGFYSMFEGFVVINDKKNNLGNAHAIVHEMMHFNSFQSIQIDKKKGEVNARRLGLKAYNAKKQEYLLSGIDEAVVEELVKRFDKKHFNAIPELEQDIKERTEAIDKLAKKHPDKKREIFEDTSRFDKAEGKYIQYGYENERSTFNHIVHLLYKDNKDVYDSEEEVFELFANALMTGNLMGPATLFKETLGDKKSFRQFSDFIEKYREK